MRWLHRPSDLCLLLLLRGLRVGKPVASGLGGRGATPAGLVLSKVAMTFSPSLSLFPAESAWEG